MVARVFQDPMAGTCEALTIEENMALAHGARRAPRLRLRAQRNLRELFREKLSILKLGLENRLADRIGLLSGGQRQAVSLLMASLQAVAHPAAGRAHRGARPQDRRLRAGADRQDRRGAAS
jgi:putative ABC transport system ATP-binding protein